MQGILTSVILFSLIYAPGAGAQVFKSVSENAGLDIASDGNGVAVADFDLDGDLDIYFVARKQFVDTDSSTYSRLFRNSGNGTFEDVTGSAGVVNATSGYTTGQMGNTFGAAWGDYNNDSFPDLFISQLGPDILYHNNGDGTFTNIAATANVEGDNNLATHSSAAWWDYDLDGDLDLYVSNWTGKNTLYENQDVLGFSDVTETAGLGDDGQTWTSIPIDADRDGLTDLYVVNDFGQNRFYRNNGDRTFTEATEEFGLEDEGHGMGVAIGDCNNDGFFDIYLTNDASFYPNPLFLGSDAGPFTESGAAVGIDNAGWAWGTEFLDYDNDTDQDLYVVNGFPVAPGENYFFQNTLAESGIPEFSDVSDTSGANNGIDARGLVVFDFDNDGRQDLLVGNWAGPPALYRNESPNAGNWLKVKLIGTESNRDGLGAKLSIRTGDVELHRHHDGVEFLGQSLSPVHFGLGPESVINNLTVHWPNGNVDTFENIPANQTVTVTENSSITTTNSPVTLASSTKIVSSYPNPFTNSVRLEFETGLTELISVEVIDLLGRRIYQVELHPEVGRNTITLSETLFPSGGVYLIALTSANSTRYSSVVKL